MTHVLFTLCVFVYVTNDAWLVFTSNFLQDDSCLIYVVSMCVRIPVADTYCGGFFTFFFAFYGVCSFCCPSSCVPIFPVSLDCQLHLRYLLTFIVNILIFQVEMNYMDSCPNTSRYLFRNLHMTGQFHRPVHYIYPDFLLPFTTDSLVYNYFI